MPTTDLIRRERLKERAQLVQRATASARRLGPAFRVSESQASHWQTDRAEYSPIFRDLEAVWVVARERTTDPTPLIAELEVLLVEGHLDSRPTPELQALLARLREEEHQHEADENRASQQSDPLRYIAALKAEARHQLLTAAVVEVLIARGLEPFGRRDA